jgi:hypothetical protein
MPEHMDASEAAESRQVAGRMRAVIETTQVPASAVFYDCGKMTTSAAMCPFRRTARSRTHCPLLQRQRRINGWRG